MACSSGMCTHEEYHPVLQKNVHIEYLTDPYFNILIFPGEYIPDITQAKNRYTFSFRTMKGYTAY